MLRGPIGIAVIVGMTVALVGPAAACRVCGDQIIFDEAPETQLSRAIVIHVRFSNSGYSFERWEELMPYNELGTLGSGRLLGWALCARRGRPDSVRSRRQLERKVAFLKFGQLSAMDRHCQPATPNLTSAPGTYASSSCCGSLTTA